MGLVGRENGVRALGRAHELLYAATPTEKTNLASLLSSYFSEMDGITDLRNLAVMPELDVDAHVPLDFSIRLTVMLNEIVLNAMNNAASAGRTNVMRISIRTGQEILTIDASETDPPGEISSGGRTQIGMTIIESLVDTLGGSIIHDQAHGRSLRVQIPLS